MRCRLVTLYTDSRMLDHRPHPTHPERPERLATILRHLDRTGQRSQTDDGTVRPATDEELLRVHSGQHLAAMTQAARLGGGQIEADTWLSTGSELAARLAAGAVVQAVADVVGGQSKRALCLVRPPGHHARPDDPMGFCLYGSVAVGAADAIHRLGLNRVLIIDWDVHHGNGTQEIFYGDPAVAFFSIHRYPFYPGSGNSDETGAGRGLGSTLNVPISYGTPRQGFLDAFRAQLENYADKIQPELILLSAGFDAHAEDPVGDLGLEIEDFGTMTKIVTDISNTHAQGRIVSVLEGGYNPSILAGCVAEHLANLSE